MKKLVLALALISSAPAFAVDFDQNDVGSPEVRYFSWCTRNTVMEEDSNGKVVVKQNCTPYGQVCAQEERPMGYGRVVYAFCKIAR